MKARLLHVYCCWYKELTLSIENVFLKDHTLVRNPGNWFPVISKMTELKGKRDAECVFNRGSECVRWEWWWGVSTKSQCFTCDAA